MPAGASGAYDNTEAVFDDAMLCSVHSNAAIKDEAEYGNGEDYNKKPVLYAAVVLSRAVLVLCKDRVCNKAGHARLAPREPVPHACIGLGRRLVPCAAPALV